jgi:hypothetical protein
VFVATLTDAAREAQEHLRDAGGFDWALVTLVGLALYVYAVEVERRRWDVVLAGLAFWLVDWFNEIVNSVILHATDTAPLWTVSGHTSYLILIGLTIEISLLFLVAGVVFVKQLPEDRAMRILGVPNRVFLVLAFSCFCVLVEVVLHAWDVFHWHYWYWDVPFVPLIVLLGYGTFFAAAAWVYDQGSNRRRQLRFVGGLTLLDLVLAAVLGPMVGWL